MHMSLKAVSTLTILLCVCACSATGPSTSEESPAQERLTSANENTRDAPSTGPDVDATHATGSDEDRISRLEGQCDEDDWDACETLVVEFLDGKNVEKDADRAEDYLLDLCQSAGFRRCMYAFSTLNRLKIDEAVEVFFSVLATLCRDGEAEACTSYARLVLNFGKESEYRKMYHLHATPCARGDDAACHAFVELTTPPVVQPEWLPDVDLVDHLALLNRACNRGLKDACERLGEYHRTGLDWLDERVDVDEDEARSYYEKAGVPYPEPNTEKQDIYQGPPMVTVYSKPTGEIFVDGEPTGQQTPGSVELEEGEWDVTVKFETGTESKPKRILANEDVHLKLFFREE